MPRALSEWERYRALRLEAHKIAEKDQAERILENPVPTEDELAIGCFIEQLEPQVRSIVRDMYRKGYTTWCSGFHPFQIEQFLDGYFRLDEDTARALRFLDVRVTSRPRLRHWSHWTSMQFVPHTFDLADITLQWKAISNQIPDRGYCAPFDEGFSAWDFRRKYGPGEDALEIMRLERLIASKRAPRWNKRWKRRIRYLRGKKTSKNG